MSHLGTRLFANRLADPDEGLDSIVQELAAVLHDGDPLPDVSVTIYDDTREPWVQRKMAPTIDMGIVYPCVRVVTLGVDYNDTATERPSGARTRSGTLKIAVQLLLNGANESDPSTGMYLIRALGGVLARFDDPASEEDREACGIRLEPSSASAQAAPDWPLGDNVVSPGTLMISFPIIETLPLPLSLH